VETLFRVAFEALTGHPPFLWHVRLFHTFLEGRIPDKLDGPTSIGKTQTITIWLIALAVQAMEDRVTLPRRLVNVVNRRAVVDQSTTVAEKIREKLNGSDLPDEVVQVREALRSMSVDPGDFGAVKGAKFISGDTVAISTLRGERADNREWQADPSKPAIIIGTVDMVGSKLLYSGYGTSWKFRGHVAGLLGCGTMLVHDEAQLSPAFSTLIEFIARVTNGGIRMMEMSATTSGSGRDVFKLTDEELKENLIHRRVHAHKALKVHPSSDVAEDITTQALTFQHAKARVVVYVRSPETALKIQTNLRKALKDKNGERVGLLTGTLRGYERDLLSNGVLINRFRADPDRSPLEESLYLIATSAGESGIDLDSDHGVMDLTTLDSMTQRLGRINRLGNALCSEIHVFINLKEQEDDARRQATLKALERLQRHEDGRLDASPYALGHILDDSTRKAAFEEQPRTLPVTNVLLDTLSMTTLREPFGDKPRIDPYLHGVDGSPPDTTIIWREETQQLIDLIATYRKSEALEWITDTHPPRTKENLKDRSRRVAKVLKELTKGKAVQAVFISSNDRVMFKQLNQLDENMIVGGTLILPLDAGGLSNPGGMLDHKSTEDILDVSDWTEDETNARARVLVSRQSGKWQVKLLGYRNDQRAAALSALGLTTETPFEGVVQTVAETLGSFVERGRLSLKPPDDEGEEHCVLLSFGAPKSYDTSLDRTVEAPPGPAAKRIPQTLAEHLRWTKMAAERLVKRLDLDPALAEAVVLAAEEHDLGKDRKVWQASIGHPQPDPQQVEGWEPLAKSRGTMDASILRGYRHEFGSLLDLKKERDDLSRRVMAHPERDLILHLIATHHGRARPHFKTGDYDPESTLDQCEDEALLVMQRFASLQRRFGYWRLAWLEALLKTADVIASRLGKKVEDL